MQDEEHVLMHNMNTRSEKYDGSLDGDVNACDSCNKSRRNNAGRDTVCPAYNRCDDKKCASCRAAMEISRAHGQIFIPKALKEYYEQWHED